MAGPQLNTSSTNGQTPVYEMKPVPPLTEEEELMVYRLAALVKGGRIDEARMVTIGDVLAVQPMRRAGRPERASGT